MALEARRAEGGISRRDGAVERCETRRHPGSASVAQQVPAFPLKGGCRDSDRGLRRRSPHIRKQKAPGNKARQLECGIVDNYRTIFEDFEAVYLLGIQIIDIPKNI